MVSVVRMLSEMAIGDKAAIIKSESIVDSLAILLSGARLWSWSCAVLQTRITGEATPTSLMQPAVSCLLFLRCDQE
jgi:hypothetical protein